MRSLRILLVAAAAATAAACALPAASAAAPSLEVGVGRADITPPTGYYMMGWVRSDGKVTGQNTRLWARVIVLKEGGQKVALVAEDLNGIPGGMMAAAAGLDSDIGFSEQNVLDSASHTHAAPTSFYNFSTYNSVFMTVRSPTDFDLTGTIDPQLYAFMVRRLALAIRRANANLGPGEIGWGSTQITDLTQNRSLEAHLANFGINLPYGQGTPQMDPGGPIDTIDPNVNVMRVDKLFGRRREPVGMWSTFADHGTVDKFQFTYYNEDHFGSATQDVEAAIRKSGHVPAVQDVVNAYGNSDEGDMSAGLVRSGPAAADWVGKVEAAAFLSAWQQAGSRMESAPQLSSRWTRMCFCGQQTPDGPVADKAALGLSEFTGSEEGRGPLFDVTRVQFEGDHLPVNPGNNLPLPIDSPLPVGGPQGDKIVTPAPLTVPTAVPMMALRIGDRLIVSVPGEMTVEMGRRVRAAVLAAAAGSGISTAVISGLANEYADYFTTPQEYDAQHYEGGATIYGRASSDALEQVLTQLAGAIAHGAPAPPAYPYDPTNGVSADAAPFPDGPASATPVSQPAASDRLGHPTFSWQGGPRGYDRPLDSAFVTVQRQVAVRVRQRIGSTRPPKKKPRRRHPARRSQPAFTGRSRYRFVTVHRWTTVTSDLGLQILWTVDSNGVYRAEWEVPLDAPAGTYRFLIQANHYTLTSNAFAVNPTGALTIRRVPAAAGHLAVMLDYPQAQSHENVGDPAGDSTADLTYRPPSADAGKVTFLVGGHPHTVSVGHGGVFTVPVAPGASVAIRPGDALDSFGNSAAAGFSG